MFFGTNIKNNLLSFFCFVVALGITINYSLLSFEMSSDTTTQQKNTKSPTMAIVYSAICPGLGQIYVEQYWKAPIFLAGAGILTYFIIDNHKNFISTQNEYDKLEDKNSLFAQNLFRKKEFYRDNRDLSFAFLLGVYILSAVDAYTNAHLYNFDVENVAINLKIDKSNLLKISLSFNF